MGKEHSKHTLYCVDTSENFQEESDQGSSKLFPHLNVMDNFFNNSMRKKYPYIRFSLNLCK